MENQNKDTAITAHVVTEPGPERSDRALVPQVIPREAAFSLVPRSFAELETMAVRLASSGLVPKELRDKPGDIIVAMETLRTIGLNPIAGLQGAFVVNGRVSIFGEWWLGLIQGSAVYLGHEETWDADTMTATVTMHRKGVATPFIGTFSMEQAVKAGLAGKDLYKQYPEDMLMWRARHRAGSAGFADVLHGIIPHEIADDFTALEGGEKTTVAMPKRRSETVVATVEAAPAPEKAPAELTGAAAPAQPVTGTTAPAPAPAPPSAPAPAPPSAPAGPEVHTIKRAASVSLPKAKGGGSHYEITLGTDQTFVVKDAALYRAAALAEEGKYPVKVMFTGGAITLIAPAK